jgi:hypothetical protein
VFQSSELVSWREEDLSESFAPTVWSVPLMAASTDVVFPLGGIIVELAFSSNEYGVGSPGENSSFGLPERATTASSPPPSCGRRLGESVLVIVCGFSCVEIGGHRGSGPEWWLFVEAAASGSMVGSSFMRRICCLHGMGGNLVSLVRRGCRLG